MGGSLYLSASDGRSVIGREIWKSHGTDAGTIPIADIRPGVSDSSPPYDLTDVGGTLMFGADDGTHRRGALELRRHEQPARHHDHLRPGRRLDDQRRHADLGFSSDLAGATFECKLDSDAYASCTSPKTIGPLADGSFHTLCVRAVAGSTDPTPGLPQLHRPRAPNYVHLGSVRRLDDQRRRSGPSVLAPTSPVRPSMCKVDSGALAPCTSPKTIGPLANASSHTFCVRAVAGGTDPTPACRSFTVHLPDTGITSGPADGSTISDDTPTFGFGSDVAGADLRVQGGLRRLRFLPPLRRRSARSRTAPTPSASARSPVAPTRPQPAAASRLPCQHHDHLRPKEWLEDQRRDAKLRLQLQLIQRDLPVQRGLRRLCALHLSEDDRPARRRRPHLCVRAVAGGGTDPSAACRSFTVDSPQGGVRLAVTTASRTTTTAPAVRTAPCVRRSIAPTASPARRRSASTSPDPA